MTLVPELILLLVACSLLAASSLGLQLGSSLEERRGTTLMSTLQLRFPDPEGGTAF